MKRVFRIIAVLVLALQVNTAFSQSDDLVNTCALNIGNATYLKDYKVALSASNVTPPSAKFNVIMNKGTMYKITVCNEESTPGEAIVKLMENNTLLGTNLKADGGFVSAVGFQCQKTGMYTINISFKDGKEGKAVAILSYINAN